MMSKVIAMRGARGAAALMESGRSRLAQSASSDHFFRRRRKLDGVNAALSMPAP
jgi:hypothetical protein